VAAFGVFGVGIASARATRKDVSYGQLAFAVISEYNENGTWLAVSSEHFDHLLWQRAGRGIGQLQLQTSTLVQRRRGAVKPGVNGAAFTAFAVKA